MKATLFAVLLSLPFAARAENGAKLFTDLCAPCHSIGGGVVAGPDLVAATHWTDADLRKALKRMEENVGPLKPEQTDALIALLKAPDVKAQLAAANAPPVELSPEEKAASAATGRRLFFGEQPFAKHGTPCFACHAIGGRGGNLAADLSGVYARRGQDAVLSVAQQPKFPFMKAAYAGRELTRQEAFHLAAFFKESNAAPQRERTGVVHAAASGLAIAALGVVALVARSRRGGVRSRMVRKSAGGE
jgi:mono/diheme cytochrome c family protein